MGYFPFFMELSHQEGLIVGGGTVALRKIQKITPYGAHLTVSAPSFLPEIESISGLTLLRQEFDPALLDRQFFVIAATNDHELNHYIASLCQQRHIPVNVVDDRDACTFLFPALVKRGDLSIGISTGGTSPSAAMYLKEQISSMIPENFAELLAYLDSIRNEVKAALPDERRRADFFSRLFITCMQTGWPLSKMEFREALLSFSKNVEGSV